MTNPESPVPESRVPPMDWHHAFSLIMSDVLTGSPFDVDAEYQLSTARQILDVLVVRRRGGDFDGELPDGFEDLADHNLISFKSHQEPFDLWTVQELVAYFVLYRKQASLSRKEMIPVEQIRLYGVTARFPSQLAEKIELKEVRRGVYNLLQPVVPIRLIVVRDLPETPANAGLELLSASESQINFAIANYRQKNPEVNSLVSQIIEHYRGGIPVADPMIKFKQQVREQWLKEMTVEERLAGLKPEDLLSRMDTKVIAQSLSPEDRLTGLKPEDRLAGLSAEEIENYLRRLRGNPNDPA